MYVCMQGGAAENMDIEEQEQPTLGAAVVYREGLHDMTNSLALLGSAPCRELARGL